MINRIKDYFKKESWNKPLNEYSLKQLWLIKQYRILKLALKGFNENRVQIRASALTYYTMLSIVPIAAMAFSVAKGFGFEQMLELKLKESLQGQEEVMEYIIAFANKYISNTQGGLIAGVGLILLLWSIIQLLSNIEAAFNDIWEIKKSRVMSRKLSDYISLVVIAPMLIFISSGANVFFNSQLDKTNEFLPILNYFWIVKTLAIVAPFIIVWLVFTLLYIIMPNTKVSFKTALSGGVIAGTAFQILQLSYMLFQSELSSYGAIYGSFAALPLFLIWLQLSWLIVLFGAEIAFANQNIGHYESESESYNISMHLKRIVSLVLVRKIALNFKNGHAPQTAEQLSNELNFPVRLVRDIIHELFEVGIVSETVTSNVKENAYQPAFDINLLNVGYIIRALDKRGNDNLIIMNEGEIKKISNMVDTYSKEFDVAKINMLLVDI